MKRFQTHPEQIRLRTREKSSLLDCVFYFVVRIFIQHNDSLMPFASPRFVVVICLTNHVCFQQQGTKVTPGAHFAGEIAENYL